jgi:hypothetical protein
MTAPVLTWLVQPEVLEFFWNNLKRISLCGIAGIMRNGPIPAPMTAVTCRRMARRCLIRARRIVSPANRATVIDLAVAWMRLAERAKRNKPIVQQQQRQGHLNDE